MLRFPKNFVWGVACSGHQVEGYNIHSDWWRYEQSRVVARQPLSGLANDYWNRYREDHALMQQLGVKAACFGVEWPRLEPAPGRFDVAALDHYRRLADDLAARGIAVGIDLNHWMLPTWFADQGAWLHPRALQHWERLMRRVIGRLGPPTDWWMSICEPMVVVMVGYVLGLFPPRQRNPVAAVKVFRTLLKLHALTYGLVHELAPRAPGGGPAQVGYANAAMPVAPWHAANSPLGRLEALFGRAAGWASWEVWDECVRQGRVLPPFGAGEEIAGLKNSVDWVGVNYYSRYHLRLLAPHPPFVTVMDPPGGGRKTQMGYPYDPAGFYDVLLAAHRRFPGVPLYVTENGCADEGDDLRQQALVDHLTQVHRAIGAGADIRGYFYWTLTDNFEWLEGYTKHFGLVAVDRSSPALTRTPRPSAFLYRDIIRRNGVRATPPPI